LSFIQFPQKLTDWTLNHINEYIKLRDIEGIRFDFKSRNFNEGKGLSTHICAMANVIGGFIVLGIDILYLTYTPNLRKKGMNFLFRKSDF